MHASKAGLVICVIKEKSMLLKNSLRGPEGVRKKRKGPMGDAKQNRIIFWVRREGGDWVKFRGKRKDNVRSVFHAWTLSR